jgi:hypothetical protein
MRRRTVRPGGPVGLTARALLVRPDGYLGARWNFRASGPASLRDARTAITGSAA